MIKGLLTLASLVAAVVSDCPFVKDSDISPCVCLTNQIRCEGQSVTDQVLANVLATIDKSRPTHFKDFQGLELYNTAVTKLNTEIFGKINLRTFLKVNSNPIQSLALGNFADLVLLDAANNRLSNVSADTFLGLTSLQYVNLAGNQIQDFPTNTFSETDTLRRLDISNNKIRKLYPDQFSSEFHNNIELSEIDLSDNELTSLPENIFWPLRRPVLINLAHNKLTSMERNALSFGEDAWSFDPIVVVLSANGIKNSDLKAETVEHLVRQKLSVRLDLSGNALTSLNQTVFQPLLKANAKSSVVLDENPIKCGDCANKWLFTDKSVSPSQVVLDKCSDDAKRSLQQFTDQDFKNC